MKKMISMFMVISLLLCLCAFTVSAEEEITPNYWIAETPDIAPEDIPGTVLGLKGDSDKNNNVNVKDATAIQKHIVGIATIDEIALSLSDVDFSRDVNIKDATAIQKWVAGVTPEEESYISHIYYEAYALDEKVFGKWECTTDMGAMINKLLLIYAEEDPLIAQHVKISSCPVTETYEFFNDYSYTITTDEKMYNDAIEIIKADLTKGLNNYLVAVAKDLGMNMTSQELLALMGYSSMEEYINELFALDSLVDVSEPIIGYYRTTPDGKIYLDEYTDTYYNFYTIEGDTLTLTGDNENIMPELYPIVFERIK